jgi:uncharacterized repeat protein (TIGR01451 family)
MPTDEFLCDGGDHDDRAATSRTGNLAGVEPRDALVRFQAERSSPRVLPTNMVCIYAPRFAAVRRPFGVEAHTTVDVLAANERLERQELRAARQGPRRFTKNQAPHAARERLRPSELARPEGTTYYDEVRVLHSADQFTHVAGHVLNQGPETSKDVDRAAAILTPERLHAIKTAESPVVHGVVAGPNEQAMAWKPQETVGVEEPPAKPGLAVIKQVDAQDGEPGDVVTYTIRFRNMGNVDIRNVSVVDSLLPRLEYVPGSATGPQGTVFTARDNPAGSTELRWDLPAPLPPGTDGAVSFRAKIR